MPYSRLLSGLPFSPRRAADPDHRISQGRFGPRISRRAMLLAAGILPLTGVPHRLVAAQATPMANVPNTLMIAATSRDLPTGDAQLWLARIRLQPGVTTPDTLLQGAALMVVSTGTITLVADRPLVRREASTIATPGATPAPEAGTVLDAGQGALLATGTSLGVTNDGTDHAELLMLYLEERSASGMQSTPAATPVSNSPGMEIDIMASGRMRFETSHGFLVIERDVIRPGGSAISSTHNGIEVGTLESGSARVLFTSGNTTLWPSDALPATPAQVSPGSRVSIEAGDAYASRDASLVWRAGETTGTVVLRAQVIPWVQP